MKRRDALKTIGGLAGAASLAKWLPGCKGDDGPVGITTYVYLMMENRSFDHFFGGRALEGLGGDGLRAGLSNPDSNGQPIAPYPATDDHDAATASVCDPDPPHSWDAAHAQFNAGANDGFVKQYQLAHQNTSLTEPMKYLTRANVPVSWALADAYTVCHRWFSSLMGPTMVNRAYWHAGTSMGLDNNDEVFTKLATVPTIYNRIDEAGIDWAYYFGSYALVSGLGGPGPYQLDLGANDGTGRVRRFGDTKDKAGQFFTDAAAGKLPPICYIEPAYGTNDDHPPVHPIMGQELIASVYLALANSPQWKNCLLVVTYDEHGGYYDHVQPPTTVDDTLQTYGKPGFDQLGFRVPAMVIGPYAKQGYTSSVQYDHTSALKHLRNAFGLGGLTARMDAANDLADCIDMDRLARGDWAKPIGLPPLDSAEWPYTDPACTPLAPEFRADDPITSWAARHPEWFRGGDATRDLREYLNSIHAFCRANGLYRG
jgi:phospholipase C